MWRAEERKECVVYERVVGSERGVEGLPAGCFGAPWLEKH